MDTLLLQLGVGGIFAVMIIRSFIEYTKATKKNGNGRSGTETEKDIKAIVVDTNDRAKAIHNTCSRADGDGIPMVYTPRSMVECQKEIVRTQERIALSQERMVEAHKQMAETIKSINGKIRN